MNDTILSKISNIKNFLNRIKETTKLKPERLENNLYAQDIFVLNLQRSYSSNF